MGDMMWHEKHAKRSIERGKSQHACPIIDRRKRRPPHRSTSSPPSSSSFTAYVDHAATMQTRDDAESALAIHPNNSNFLHLTFGQRFGTIAIIVIDPSGSLDGKPHALVSKTDP
jgi:hypothetical protein